MTKVISKKSNVKVGKVNKKSCNEQRLEKEAHELNEWGEKFGDIILDHLDLFIVDWKDYGAAAIGLAKAVAALKHEARNEAVPVDKLFQGHLEFFEKEFANID